MNKYYIKPRYVKKKQNQAYKRREENVQPIIVNRKFDTNELNKIWCTDIAYLIVSGKPAYLSTILDLYDRKVVAYKRSEFNNNQ